MPKFVSRWRPLHPLIVIVEEREPEKADRMEQFPDGASGSGYYFKDIRASIQKH